MNKNSKNNGDLEEELHYLKRLALLLDECITIPGIDRKIGLDGLIGLIPVVGDFASGGFSLYILYQARKFKLPNQILYKMIWNITVDLSVGVIPILGDYFDFQWKANLANVNLLISYMESKEAKAKGLASGHLDKIHITRSCFQFVRDEINETWHRFLLC